MKKFKAKSIDLKKMTNIRGGGENITYDLVVNSIKVTNKSNQVITKEDNTQEVSLTCDIEVEK